MLISIVVPMLNEREHLEETLRALRAECDARCEIIVVDGGSNDGTPELAEPLADQVFQGPRGRGYQLAAGAAVAQGDVLWFLHADTRVAPGALRALREALEQGAEWGRFDVRLSGRARLLRLVEAMMNWRSRITGIATGDQGIFVRSRVLERVGGVPEQPLMEDIELSARLRRLGRPVCLPQLLTTSSRRWEERGIVRTVVLMWWLRAAYGCGVSSEQIERWYR